MFADLTSEPQARQMVSADAVIVRESRGVFDYALWLLFTGATLTGFTYPFWREYLLPEADFPSGMAVFGGFFCWMFAAIMGGDLKAARQPASWLLIFTTNQLYLHFRSYHHWKWPADDKTVLRLSPHDIEHIQPLESVIKERTGKNTVHKRIRVLEFHLRDALTPEQIDVILHENTYMPKGKYIRSRSGHKPLRVSADGRVLSLDFGRTTPDFMAVTTKLGGRYRIRPVAEVAAGTPMRDTTPDLTAAKVREIEALAASDDKIGAIRILRQYTNLSLKESKEAVEQGVERTLGSRVRRE